MILWERLGRDRIELAIKLLVQRMLGDAVEAIDGAGGDDGIDLRWDSPDGLVIIQIKSFTARWEPPGRRQIRASLTKAIMHTPVGWWLITPMDRTPGEKRWWHDTLEPDAPGVWLKFSGRTWLSEKFAGHDDLIKYVEGADHELVIRAKQAGMEQAVLAGGLPDLASRAGGLHALGQTLSPFWGVDFAVSAQGVELTIREASPDAAREDPIRLAPIFKFPANDPDADRVAKEVRRTADYGFPVTVPGRYVVEVRVEASEAFRALLGDTSVGADDSVTIDPGEEQLDPPLIARLERIDADGTLISSCEVGFLRRRRGQLGVTLIGSDPSDLLTVEVDLPYPNAAGTTQPRVHITRHAIAGRPPNAILPPLRLLSGVHAGQQLNLLIGSEVVTGTPVSAEDAHDIDAADILRLVTALADLQAVNRVSFAIPAELDVGETMDIEDMSAALRGERVRLRGGSLTAIVQPMMLPKLLNQLPSGFAIGMDIEFARTIGSYRLSIGRARVWAPRAQLQDRDQLMEMGVNVAEVAITFVPIDGEGIYLLQPHEPP
ncbi:MAG: hypothetical protein ACR2JK_02730 [Geodermatophilaceae bacterium]